VRQPLTNPVCSLLIILFFSKKRIQDQICSNRLGVIRQVDNLSPSLFNLYVNDLPSYFDKSCDPVSLNKYELNCLMYADDVGFE
jgi:hypothetical protein